MNDGEIILTEDGIWTVTFAWEWQETMDLRFDDERMHQIYPNAINVVENGSDS